MALLFLLSALPAAALEPLAPAQCRCTDVTAACFKSIPFAALNASVGGRLVAVEDEFGAVSDRPCNFRREGGKSLVIGGPSLLTLKEKACNPL